jgi:purine-binding chemotaxis protein CheW
MTSQRRGSIGAITSGPVSRYLEFNLGMERFAISLLSVREVLALPETTKVPFSPDYYQGIMNLRGQVLSVIDLRKRLQIKPLEHGVETAVIIVDLGFTLLGVVVDSINRVLAVESKDIAPTPELEKAADFVVGCFSSEKTLILLLDLDKILDKGDRDRIASAHDQLKAG